MLSNRLSSVCIPTNAYRVVATSDIAKRGLPEEHTSDMFKLEGLGG